MAKTLEGRPRTGGSEWELFIAAATLAASLCLALSGCKAVESAFDDNNESAWPTDTRSSSAPKDKHDHGGLDDDWSATLVPDSMDWW
jgi:hypothetical protein